MKVKDPWSLLGAIVLVAIIAVILSKKYTARDVRAGGRSFGGALGTATRG